MTRINIGGETYKVRQREVDGRKQEIYYKDGQAYIKNASGKLESINKFDDGVFKKASYVTQKYEENLNKNYADNLNSKYTDENRPELTGMIGDYDFKHNSDIVGYKGRFSLGNGESINGVVFRDENTNTNKVRSDSNTGNGVNVSTVYAINDDSSDFFMESRTITLPNGNTVKRTYNYDTGQYDIQRTNAEE